MVSVSFIDPMSLCVNEYIIVYLMLVCTWTCFVSAMYICLQLFTKLSRAQILNNENVVSSAVIKHEHLTQHFCYLESRSATFCKQLKKIYGSKRSVTQ